MFKHLSFPSIGSLATITKDFQYIGVDQVDYLGVVKLDGSNLSVVYHADGSMHFQSREMLLPVDGEADVYGFRSAMAAPERLKQLRQAFAAVAAYVSDVGGMAADSIFPITVYGEWAGKGVTRRTPVGRLPTAWYPFAIRFSAFDTDSSDKPIWSPLPLQIACLRVFAEQFAEPALVRSIFDFPTVALSLSATDPQGTQDRVDALVQPIEQQCPFGAAHGIAGGGEGWVFRPVGPFGNNARYWFKAKTLAHRETKNHFARHVSAEEQAKREQVDALVRDHLPEARLERGLRHLVESGQPLAKVSTGAFVRWLIEDVARDAEAQMREHQIDTRDLSTPIARVAGPWFVKQLIGLTPSA